MSFDPRLEKPWQGGPPITTSALGTWRFFTDLMSP